MPKHYGEPPPYEKPTTFWEIVKDRVGRFHPDATLYEDWPESEAPHKEASELYPVEDRIAADKAKYDVPEVGHTGGLKMNTGGEGVDFKRNGNGGVMDKEGQQEPKKEPESLFEAVTGVPSLLKRPDYPIPDFDSLEPEEDWNMVSSASRIAATLESGKWAAGKMFPKLSAKMAAKLAPTLLGIAPPMWPLYLTDALGTALKAGDYKADKNELYNNTEDVERWKRSSRPRHLDERTDELYGKTEMYP